MICSKELDLILQLVLMNYHGVVWSSFVRRKCPRSRQREPLFPSAQHSASSHPIPRLFLFVAMHMRYPQATNQDEDVCGALQVYRLLVRQG